MNQDNCAKQPDKKEEIAMRVIQESANMHEKEQLELLLMIQGKFADRLDAIRHDATSDHKMLTERLDMLRAVQETMMSGLKVSIEASSVFQKEPVPDLHRN